MDMASLDPATESSLLLQAIQTLKREVIETMNSLLKPVLEQLVKLKLSVQKISDTGEAPLKNTIMQNEIRDFQEDLSLAKDQVLSLDLAVLNRNLKFRGFPESADKNRKVLDIIGPWLAAELKWVCR